MAKHKQTAPQPQGNEELLQAYQQLQQEHQTLKELYQDMMQAPSKAIVKSLPNLPADTFEVAGNTYRMALPKMKIKDIGDRTALEVLLDDEAYQALKGLTIKEYLVSYGSTAVVQV